MKITRTERTETDDEGETEVLLDLPSLGLVRKDGAKIRIQETDMFHWFDITISREEILQLADRFRGETDGKSGLQSDTDKRRVPVPPVRPDVGRTRPRAAGLSDRRPTKAG